MTRHRSILVCSSVALVVGIVIGARWDARPHLPAARADTVTKRHGVDELYHDLSTTRGSLVEGSNLLAKIAAVATPSVVHIQSKRTIADRGTVEETGSGVIVADRRKAGRFVVTNRHVIHGAETSHIVIRLSDGRILHPERIWLDRASDVAVMKIAAADLQPARWGDSDKVQIGHMVLAMGSPFGLSRSMTFGIISAKGRRSLRLGTRGALLNQDFLQTDAAINPGNSGGPLIDLHGRVIGINTAIASNSGGNDGIGFSIPSNLARRVAEQLIERGSVRRAFLGVRLDDEFTAKTARRLRLDRVRGARIVEVYPRTPAARASLRFDDVILRFNNIDIQDENHLINLVSLAPVGSRAKVIVLRNGRRITVSVLLIDRTERTSAE